MTYENIQIATANFTVSLNGSSFFTMDHLGLRLIEKNSSGAVIFSYFLSSAITEVYSLEFDGHYFWSLERLASGFRVRKWEIDASNLVNVVQTFTYYSDGTNTYDAYSMSVESYNDTVDGTVTIGASTFNVSSGSVIDIGDRIVLGPSSSPGYEGTHAYVTVSNKVGNTITTSVPLTSTFNTGDTVSFSRNFFIFSDTSQGSETGGLYKFSTVTGAAISLDMGNQYNLVRASTFFSGSVMFVRAGEVIWIDPVGGGIDKSQAIDNLDLDRGSYISTFDLAGFSNTLYRLEQKHVEYNAILEQWESEDWAPQYNYNTSGTVPEVYFVSVKAEPPIMHKAVSGLPVEDTKSAIKVVVLDQFRSPVFNRVVDFSSTGGSVIPAQDTTDANGEAETVYTSDTTVGQVTITADVT